MTMPCPPGSKRMPPGSTNRQNLSLRSAQSDRPMLLTGIRPPAPTTPDSSSRIRPNNPSGMRQAPATPLCALSLDRNSDSSMRGACRRTAFSMSPPRNTIY